MTPNKEDYLKCIYEIGTHTQKITNKEIAAQMQVSPPAVTEMIKKMTAEKLIVKDKTNGYLLTDLGLHLVSELYRKHRLIEAFLVHDLGYTTDQIHEEAEVLEHTVSELFVERLEKMLGYPETCPHGGTIPAKGELLVEKYQLTLDRVENTGIYRLARVHDEFELLKYLEKHNLHLGDTLILEQYDPYAQLYALKVNGKELQVNSVIAQQLYVEKI
ncbi:MarR family transcriptional regulator [Streptococcus anginosus]|uniref:metal-dependent transcriptional regulator n=1 Tax=Streptococcus anginosus TaxID=1328 RepID=UPI000D0320E0|nr:metal-dependent transcriptional regulator [Streptococcus anginosus]PRT75206.1 MarR family transcriptional regulator [Streptococcus anginosus]